jgi:hypothetical protein
MLDSAPSGTTVTLAQQVVVQITNETYLTGARPRWVGLNIPSGITLATVG